MIIVCVLYDFFTELCVYIYVCGGEREREWKRFRLNGAFI